MFLNMKFGKTTDCIRILTNKHALNIFKILLFCNEQQNSLDVEQQRTLQFIFSIISVLDGLI